MKWYEEDNNGKIAATNGITEKVRAWILNDDDLVNDLETFVGSGLNIYEADDEEIAREDLAMYLSEMMETNKPELSGMYSDILDECLANIDYDVLAEYMLSVFWHPAKEEEEEIKNIGE